MISGTRDAQRELAQRENEREKEREIARRDLARSTFREIAIDVNGDSRDRADDCNPTARSREAPIAIDALRDRTVDCDPRSRCRSRDRTVDRKITPCSSGFVRVFLGFASSFFFSNFFSKHQKIFFEKYFEMQPNTWKHFLFRKIAFSENGMFSKNAFTRTKHSLNFFTSPPHPPPPQQPL